VQVLPTIRIFVASPGDLGEAGDREQVQDLVDRLSKDMHFEPRCALQCLRYDDAHRNVLFVAGQPMQQSIDDRLGTPGTCDIVIGLFWSRLGTPITRDGERFPSGTAWELHDARHGPNKPNVLVFRREPLPAMPVDRHAREALVAELNRLDAYLGSFEGTVNRYSAGRLAETLDQQLRSAILNRLEAKAPQAAADPRTAPPPQCLDRRPYPGLLPFDADDAALFFGRERETGELVRRIGDERKAFTAIVGISGSGKSSLMRAGVLPALVARGWKRVVFRPTDFDRDPRLALAAALRPLVRPTARPVDLVERWETVDAWRTDLETARGDAPGLVLAIDQAEELFTDQIDDARPLLRLLTAAPPTAGLLLTLRADFMNAATATPPLEDLLTLNTYFIGLPPPRMLVAIIREPAARVGAEVEDRLVDALVGDVGGDPGGLALLAFVLERLWELDGAGGRLRLSTYTDALGGLKGALAKHCEAVEAALDADAALGDWRPQLRKLFAHAVQVTGDADGNRRLGKKRFRTDAEPALAALAERLRAHRLLTGADDATPRFELAHEKLLEAWPDLAAWLKAQRAWLELRDDLQRDCARWLQNGRDPAFSWSHERVREAATALDELELRDDAGLDEAEREFLGPIDRDLMLAARERAETTHTERAFIGERLSVLRDPRDGVGIDDRGTSVIRWCEVPGGEVEIDAEGESVSRPVAPFRIAAYPVTVLQ